MWPDIIGKLNIGYFRYMYATHVQISKQYVTIFCNTNYTIIEPFWKTLKNTTFYLDIVPENYGISIFKLIKSPYLYNQES